MRNLVKPQTSHPEYPDSDQKFKPGPLEEEEEEEEEEAEPMIIT
jgi:hypothetical protein